MRGLEGKVRRRGLQVTVQFADQFFVVQAEKSGILPDEASREDTARQFIEALRFDKFQQFFVDFRLARNLFEAVGLFEELSL
jgi:hypothetical protein